MPSIVILIATGNPGKAREIEQVLEHGTALTGAASDRFRWKTLRDVPPIPEPHEDGETFAENAKLKALYYARATGMITLADDSGLEVDALGGRPGVRSARFAEDVPESAPRETRDSANNRKLIALLGGVPAERRTARFRCALALATADRVIAKADGVVEGVIIDTPRGFNGFGYDPHFYIPSLGRTTAELDSEHKNRISHRGRALRSLCGVLPAALGLAG
ncbi:MAG: RdgB/HAM1 family non-canonical purine NTP pyrophosphatase [Phycisphaerae bacterium]|nr:RdgB/HAM1 family non-canonical purine NTP pyrophosphatase [Phycisphaerae bacterium]